MFNNIRKTIANALSGYAVSISPNTITVPAGATSLTTPQAPAHLLTQYERSVTTPLTGAFHVSNLETLSSEYLKDAVAQLGAWSALARAFNEYEKVVSKRVANDVKLGQLIDEFHCWNATCSTGKQMDEEAIIIAADKIAVQKPAKGDATTDAIIARVRKCTVAELKAAREAMAAKQSAARAELLTGFVATMGSFTSGDMNPSISNAKVAAKAIQTLEWVATSWQGDPAGIAAELLLIEGDIATIEAAAKREDMHDDREFIDGTLTSDHMMNSRAA